MLRKKRNSKHRLPMAEVNIVSLMDILTTLLFFILMVMSFSKFSMLSGTALVSGTSSNEEKKNVFALKITIKNENQATIYLGPTTGLKIVNESELQKYFGQHFKGGVAQGYTRHLNANDLKGLSRQIGDNLIAIKRAFPHEHKVVLEVADKLQYQHVVQAMDGIRSLPEGVEGFTIETLVGSKEKTRVLFPQVILAEM